MGDIIDPMYWRGICVLLVRAVGCAFFTLTAAAPVAVANADDLAGECRAAFYMAFDEGNQGQEGELGHEAAVAKHSAAYDICETAADAGSTNARLFWGMLTLPLYAEYKYLQDATMTSTIGETFHLFEIANGDWLNPAFVFEVVKAYYRSRQGYELVRKAAEEGDPEAQFYYADMIETGVRLMEGGWALVEQDEEKALQFMRLAAEGGDPEAQAIYGRKLLRSKQIVEAGASYGVYRKDLDDNGSWTLDELEYADGLEYLVRAAFQGNAFAASRLVHKVYNLGNYDDGSQLGPLNLAKAEKYCELAIRKAFPAQLGGFCAGWLGIGYANPDSLYGQDFYASAYWLSLLHNRFSLENFSARHLKNFQHYFVQLDKSRAELTEAQIAELEEETRIAIHPACGNPYYRARHSYDIMCPNGRN